MVCDNTGGNKCMLKHSNGTGHHLFLSYKNDKLYCQECDIDLYKQIDLFN